MKLLKESSTGSIQITSKIAYFYEIVGIINKVWYILYSLENNSMARKLPIQKWMGKIAVQLKSHGESEIARN